MPQRRSPFGYGMGDGQSQGGAPTVAMPLTGTGTEGADVTQPDAEQLQADPFAESPATLRRRLMPVAGQVRGETGALDLAQHILQRRGV